MFASSCSVEATYPCQTHFREARKVYFCLLSTENVLTFLDLQEEKLALSVGSYFGCGLSMLGLAGTIFLHFREK